MGELSDIPGTEVEEQVSSPVSIEQLVGKFLSDGYDNLGVITALLETNAVASEEEAVEVIKGVYESWKRQQDSFDDSPTNILNWHIRNRLSILRKAVKINDTAGLNLGLRVLDSLAPLQGVSLEAEMGSLEKPIRIELVEVQKVTPKQDSEDEER